MSRTGDHSSHEAVAAFTAQPFLLDTAIVIAGFGRGAGGAAGPFSPAEQAWLAEDLAPGRRGWVYSLNAATGLFGMGLGALIASLPAVWRRILPGPAAYRPLFALVGLLAIAGFTVIWAAAEALNVGISTIAAWCRSGRLDGIRAAPRGYWWIKLTPELIAELRKPVRQHWKNRSSK